MPRSYYRCPCCPWALTWAFARGGRDEDPGLVVAKHMELAHTETVYGSLMPASVARRLVQLAGAR